MTEEAAKESGLKKGTPVIVGTGDSTAEAISVGLVESELYFSQYGSSMFYYYCVDRYVDDYVSANGNGSLKGWKGILRYREYFVSETERMRRER